MNNNAYLRALANKMRRYKDSTNYIWAFMIIILFTLGLYFMLDAIREEDRRRELAAPKIDSTKISDSIKITKLVKSLKND